MSDDEIAVRQEQVLRDIALDVNIARLVAELGRIPIAPNRQEQRFVAGTTEGNGSEKMRGRRRRPIRVAEAGRLECEMEKAEEHLGVRVWRQAVARAQTR